MRPRVLAATLLLAFAPATAPCRAQTNADATTAMARARFKEGVNFYDKGDFDQARASFLQAYALKKHPAVLLNLAWSCLKSGHPLEAERYFEQLPTESEVSDKQRADAADGVSQARAKLGRIEVIAGSGNEVSVDGVRVGLVPLAEAVLVEPGAHTVKLTAADGATDIRRVTVLAGEKGVARFGVDEAPTVAPAEGPAVAPPPVAAVPETPVAAAPPRAPGTRKTSSLRRTQPCRAKPLLRRAFSRQTWFRCTWAGSLRSQELASRSRCSSSSKTRSTRRMRR